MIGLLRVGVGLILLVATLAVAAIHLVSVLGYHIPARLPLFFSMFGGAVLAGWLVAAVAASANRTLPPSLWKLFEAAPGWVRGIAIVVALNAIANVALLVSHRSIKWHESDGRYFVHENGIDREVNVSVIDAETDHLMQSSSGIVLWFYVVMLAYVYVWPDERARRD